MLRTLTRRFAHVERRGSSWLADDVAGEKAGGE